MDERRIEAALTELSRQKPRAPSKEVEDMVHTVELLNRERAKRMGKTAEPVRRERTLSTGNPEKDKNNNRPL